MTTLDRATQLLIEQGSPVTLDVTSDSMLPTLPPAASVRVDPGDRLPRRGDLIVFRQADYLVVHRCLGPARTRSGAACLRARGDAARPLDPPVAPDQILGVVVAVRRGEEWRSLRGALPRAYALSVAWHGLFWAWLRSLAPPGSLQGAAASADRALLGAADRLFFRLAHPRTPPPPG